MPHRLATPDPTSSEDERSLIRRHLDRSMVLTMATTLGQRCREGVLLQTMPIETWWMEQGSVHLPYPGSKGRIPAPPSRTDVESAFELYAHELDKANIPLRTQHQALRTFFSPLPLPVTDRKAWQRVYLEERLSQTKHGLRVLYHGLLTQSRWDSGPTTRGSWTSSPRFSLEEVRAEIARSFAHPVEQIKTGARTRLWSGELFGEPVVIKRYERNPRKWRRRLERCRAKRAWAGALVLREAGIAMPDPLGWLEILSGEDQGVSFFISSPLPPSETVRTWLRREWPQLSPNQRILFRHQFRRHLMVLYAHGLVHLDCKLSNIRILTSTDSEKPSFIWTDLEDIRPQFFQTRTFIRNMYQLNGSLPRSLSRADRIHFLRGFRSLFTIARSNALIRYVQRKTRRRHLRELKRQCGA